MNTYKKHRGGGAVMVNQESDEDSCLRGEASRRRISPCTQLGYLLRRTSRRKLPLPPVTSHKSPVTRSRLRTRIMCPPLQESTPCTIASLAAPDGTLVKLVTACGDSQAGAAPTMLNRSTPCSAPSISAAIFLTPRGPTAKAAANKSSEKSCAPTPEKNFTSPRKFRPKTSNGPAAAISPLTIAIRRTTSKPTSTRR